MSPPVHEDYDAADLEFEFDYLDEIKALIAGRIAQHERSRQTAIGPSQMGTACHRKLAYALAGVAPIEERDGPEAQWRQTVGTAVHTWLAAALLDANERELATMHSGAGSIEDGIVSGLSGPPGTGKRARRCPSWCTPALVEGTAKTYRHTPRWAVEFGLPVGTIDGDVIHGHVDAYDRMRHVVLDWKIVGPKAIKDKHAHGPGPQNKAQAMIYAGGHVARGEPVERVVLCYLPMNGELRDGFIWSARYDPAIRKAAFARARDLSAAIKEEGIEALAPRLGTAPDYCHRCAWFAPGEPATGAHCPGDKSLLAGDAPPDAGFEDLL